MYLFTLALGASSGLPLFAIGSTLQAWMKETGVDLSVIGAFSLTGLPYTVKFLWAPLLDRYSIPRVGRRRGWLIISQLGLCAGFVALAAGDPAAAPYSTALAALFIAFASATQDIVLDAHRRESFSDSELGLATSVFVNGYRLGLIISGAVALSLADVIPWSSVYLALAGLMVVFAIVGAFVPEPDNDAPPPRTLRAAVVEPLLDYFNRPGAWLILTFILAYKLGDTIANALSTPYFLDIGYQKSAIAAVAKSFGIIATLLGALLAGALMTRLGIRRALWIFGGLQMVSTITYLLPQLFAPTWGVLVLVIAIENGTGGMGTTAFTTYMAKLCNRSFTATQYALLSSLVGIPRVLFGAPSGALAQTIGWFWFFVFCTAIAVPAFFLLARISNESER